VTATATTRPGRLNRTLLVLLGLVVLAVGALVVVASLGLLGGQDTPVLPQQVLTYLIEQPWVPYAVAAVGIIVALLAIRWLLAQLPHRASSGRFRLKDDSGRGVTSIDADTVADAVRHDLQNYAGVSSARAGIHGSRDRPTATLTLVVDPDTDIRALQTRVHEHAILRMSEALGAQSVTTRLLVSVSRSRQGDRVS